MDKKDVGARIRALRNFLKLTQQQFADKVSVSRSMLSQIESGASMPTVETLLNIHEVFDVDPNFWFSNDAVMLTNDVSKTGKSDVLVDNSRPLDYWNEKNFYLKHQFEKRVYLDLLKNHPDLGTLYSQINDLGAFRFVIENLFHYYFNSIDMKLHSSERFLKDNQFDYESYKQSIIEELSKWEPIREIIGDLKAAIDSFYQQFKQFDSENVIAGSLGQDVTDSKS